MKGFTLLETMIAMVMTAFILIAVYGAYTTSAESIQSARERAQEYQTARIVLDLMRKDLQGAIVWDISGVEGEKRELDGKPADRIQMMTSTCHAAVQDVRTGLYRVSYEMVKDEETAKGYILYRTQEGILALEMSTVRQRYALTRMVSGLELRYLDKDGREVEGWKGAEGNLPAKLPSLVRVRLTLMSPSGRERVFTTAVYPELAGSAP